LLPGSFFIKNIFYPVAGIDFLYLYSTNPGIGGEFLGEHLFVRVGTYRELGKRLVIQFLKVWNFFCKVSCFAVYGSGTCMALCFV